MSCTFLVFAKYISPCCVYFSVKLEVVFSPRVEMWIALAVSGYTNSSGQQSTLCAELCLCNRVLAELCRRMSLEKPESDYSAPAQALLSPALAWLPHTWHQPRNAGNSQRGRYFIYLKVIPSLNAYFFLSF